MEGWILKPTLQDSSCLFAAIRKQLDVCYEFTTQHLRRWLVYRMVVHHHQYFYNLFKDAIAKVYGFYRYSPGELAALKKKGKGLSKAALKEQKMPGPFTFKDWIQYLLDPHGWGDNMVIMAFSLSKPNLCHSGEGRHHPGRPGFAMIAQYTSQTSSWSSAGLITMLERVSIFKFIFKRTL